MANTNTKPVCLMAVQGILYLNKPLDSCFWTHFLHISGLNTY